MKYNNPNECKCLRCLRCNRILKTEEAKQRGYGDKCWIIHKKEMEANHNRLFKILS